MASKKVAAKKRSEEKAPEGFREIDNSLAGFWKPTEVGQTLQGVVGRQMISKGAEGKPNVFYAIRITDPKSGPIVTGEDEEVTIEGGELVGVGGAILGTFLGGREGQEVFLVFKGMGEKKAGKNPARLYATYVKEYDSETGETIPH